MRDPDRISETLAVVERLWRQYPDWRLGQLLDNVAAWADQSAPEIEDDDLVAEIERHMAGVAARKQVAVPVES